MALNNFKRNHLMLLHFKGLIVLQFCRYCTPHLAAFGENATWKRPCKDFSAVSDRWRPVWPLRPNSTQNNWVGEWKPFLVNFCACASDSCLMLDYVRIINFCIIILLLCNICILQYSWIHSLCDLLCYCKTLFFSLHVNFAIFLCRKFAAF